MVKEEKFIHPDIQKLKGLGEEIKQKLNYNFTLTNY
jgi:hypothetical protein